MKVTNIVVVVAAALIVLGKHVQQCQPLTVSISSLYYNVDMFGIGGNCETSTDERPHSAKIILINKTSNSVPCWVNFSPTSFDT